MSSVERIIGGIKKFVLTTAVFAVLTLVSFFFRDHSSDPTLNIAMLYTLGIFLVTRFTGGTLFGILFSLASVLSVNYFFTFPYDNFNFTMEGYQVAFLGMLLIAILTSVMVSKMHQQEEQLLKQAQELAEQEKKLLEGEKEKMRANLLRAVSHDLRTPLTGILGNTASFLETYESMNDDERIELVKSVNTDADWLLNMVENLLSVTRINQTNASVKKTLEPVDEVVSAAVIKFRKRFPEAEINVTVPDELVMAEMDVILIQQVIINILQNAQMHSQSVKPLELSVNENGGQVEFHIRDYGVGIAPNKLETIFDAEGTGEESASADGFKGMGIGLSICRTIVLAHDGEIMAKNHSDGAEFIFTLPGEKPDSEDIDE